ncbi:unnamed protein product [Angiostrongylus costaricensis]|uniref:FHA domain-containing protein n=1 Tax=Angiostrongylus costaricensis TaxID=334426 RepID=A0A0R3PB94_ANGCS|nr:unnamed protein product [Angiostrongylus costaricensis]
MVSIGRDRKCGIALAVDAHGVSRIHGSLKWITLQDNSTYGTVVNGRLVKGACQTLQDGAHIFVGDVELVIVFPQHQHRISSFFVKKSCTVNVTDDDCITLMKLLPLGFNYVFVLVVYCIFNLFVYLACFQSDARIRGK